MVRQIPVRRPDFSGIKGVRRQIVGRRRPLIAVVIQLILIMNILILTGSPRKGGNTDILAKSFADGASKHHHVDIVRVCDLHINPCIGCNSCFLSDNHRCCQHDDMHIVYEKMGKADMLVIASPVYFYGISAQLKAVIDRFHNPIRDTFNIKKMALLLVGAASLPDLFDAIIAEYGLCLRFFDIEDAGRVLARGVNEKGDINKTSALEEAFRLGSSVNDMTRDERIAYVDEQWKCLNHCPSCGKCHILKGRDPETLYADFIDGKRSYMDITLEIRK